jgi:hypothetical protein
MSRESRGQPWLAADMTILPERFRTKHFNRWPIGLNCLKIISLNAPARS